MRAPALITVAAITAIAVVALLLTGLPDRSAAPTKTPASAANASPTPPPAKEMTPAPVQPAAPIATAPTPAADAAPAETKAPNAAPSTKAEEVAAAEPVGAAADSADAGTDEESEEGDEDSDEASAAVDVGRAADLLADWMAKQDAAADEGGSVPGSVTALRAFDGEKADPAWSEPTAQQIEAALEQWLDALPDEVRQHIEIIHVECRETYCQILAADNDLGAQNERAQASQEWQQAIATLPHQPWWNELGFVDVINAVDSDSGSGYILYQTYLRREVKPAG